MFKTTATKPDELESFNITWLENWARGAKALLIHPFAPLAKTSFNFSCLFSKEPYCIVFDSEDPVNLSSSSYLVKLPDEPIAGYTDLIRHGLSSIFKGLNFTDTPNTKQHPSFMDIAKERALDLYTYLFGYVEATRSPQIFLISQLILCTIILSYFLFRDVKEIIHQIYSKRNIK